MRTSGDRPTRAAWVDVRAGVGADLLLGALLDAGAAMAQVRAQIAAVLPDAVLLTAREVSRGGQRATRPDLRLRAEQPDRTWADVRALLQDAPLPGAVRAMALGVCRQLAAAQARAHGGDADEVRFGAAGAWAEIAGVVGVCAALHDLGVARLYVGEPVAVGSGSVTTPDGEVAVPAPAVLELARGFAVTGGGDGALATPIGLALLRALAGSAQDAPPLVPDRIGVGAGEHDDPGRAHVLRLVLGPADDHAPVGPTGAAGAAAAPGGDGIAGAATSPALRSEPGSGYLEDSLVLLEASVDDLDPRVWPSVLVGLLGAGALDAWLTPISLTGGRSGHVVGALVAVAERRSATRAVLPGDGVDPVRAPADPVAAVRDALFRLTPTFAVRARPTSRWSLHRDWVPVDVAGERVRIKVGYTRRPAGDVEIVRATPEFEDAADLAARWGVAVGEILDAAAAAAMSAGLVPGASYTPTAT